MKISRDRLLRDIAKLAEIGRTEEGGVSRFAFTEADVKARRMVAELMEEAGLRVRVDQVGNIIGRREGSNPDLPVVMTGSHIDTVPNGGMLDGALGVLGGIEAERSLRGHRIKTQHPIEVIVFTNEEGARFPGTSGSSAVAGVRDVQEIYRSRDSQGTPFLEAMKAAGLNPEGLPAAKREPASISAFVELHPEQGPVLEAEGIPVGVVESIVGITQLKVSLEGRADHAGTTPMNTRRDALLAASRLVQEVNRIGREGRGVAVATVGFLRVSPGAFNVVPGRVEMGIDFRDASAENLGRMVAEFSGALKEVAAQHGVAFLEAEHLKMNPTPMSPRVASTIERAAETVGVKAKRVVSGAGHDAQVMAKVTDAGMIFSPSRGGRSHCPEEWTEPEHLALGAEVLFETLMALARAE